MCCAARLGKDKVDLPTESDFYSLANCFKMLHQNKKLKLEICTQQMHKKKEECNFTGQGLNLLGNPVDLVCMQFDQLRVWTPFI
jgi:hypothetical protein